LQHALGGSGPPGNNRYKNDQSHKYVGYKMLSKDTWRIETVLDEAECCGEGMIPEGALRMDALFGCW
jgi:hypothetical protein